MPELQTNERYARLVELLGEVRDIEKATGVLYWDQQTKLPRAGTPARGNHLTTLSKLSHERLTNPEIGSLLEELKPYEESLPYDSDEASTLRVARRLYERATKLPPDLVVRMTRARVEGHRKWLEAREARDFQVFLPALESIYELTNEAVEILGYDEHPMDALVDQREPGMTVADLEKLFTELREDLVPLVEATGKNLDAVDDSVLHQYYDHADQLRAAEKAVRAIGFDLDDRGRMDLSVHPFTIGFSNNDVRITTRVDENFLGQSFFAALHEAGHGTYEQGYPAKFERSILGSGASGGIHESQSRLWENIVGRSRAFWEFFYPQLCEIFPEQLRDTSEDEFFRTVNKVYPSFIRVEADEVTYNLHIMIRFELEKAVFDGQLKLSNLDDAWNQKFREYLGIEPPNDLVGVLQDIHWSGGFGAGFQSYTIGNVASVQLYERALKDLPHLEEGFARGEFAELLTWMNDNVHAHGSKFKPQELLERVTGRELDAGPYLAYIKRKFGEIYKL